MAQEATNTTDILASLKTNNQGWSIGLFQDQHAVQSFVCFQCKCVCCDAVELGCDHDDDDIFLYCHSCLTQLVNQNDNKCPIDQHNDPTIIPNRTLRRQISKSMTYCPYSSAYKSDHPSSHKNDDNNQIMDTLGGDGDQKEGNPQVVPYSPPSSSHGCQWQGTLNDLTQKHIVACMQKNDPSYSLRIKIKDLQQENAQMKQLIIDLKNAQSERSNDAERYKAQIVALQNQIQQKQTKIDQLKTENKQSQKLTEAVLENVTIMQNEVGFQSFQIDKLKQENIELKIKMGQLNTTTEEAKRNESPVAGAIKLVVELQDRLDVLMVGDGQIKKHQIVGTVSFKSEDIVESESDACFIGNVLNLENTKTKIFNPLTTNELDDNGGIRVKLAKPETKDSIGVLKYIWNAKHIEKYLPFLIALKTEMSQGIYHVECVIKPNVKYGNGNGKLKEFSITGQLKNAVDDCIDNSDAYNIEFVWSDLVSNRFIWRFKADTIDKEYRLNAKFKSDPDNSVQLKIQCEIENIRISTIKVNTQHSKKNNADIIKTIQSLRFGEFIVRK
eukprot:408125_1